MLSRIVITSLNTGQECSISFQSGFNAINAHDIDDLCEGLDEKKKRKVILLAIDYAFGGIDFSDRGNNPAILFLGSELDLRITFIFSNVEYDFFRSTETPDEVKFEDRVYPISIREYQRRLAEMYTIEDTYGFTFYSIVGRFFRMRIPGRDNLDIYNPLHARKRERATTPLRVLEILFSRPESLITTRRELDDLSIEKGTYNNAVHYGLINIDGISLDANHNGTQSVSALPREEIYESYHDNSNTNISGRTNPDYWKKPEVEKIRYAEARVKNESRRKELAEQKHASIQKIDDEITRKLDDIDKEIVIEKRKLALLYSQRLSIQSQINTIKANLSDQDIILQTDIERIKRFFPNADLRHIEEVNSFHSKMGTILSSEMQEEITKLSTMLNAIDDEISVLTSSLKEHGEYVNISSDGLIQFERIISESALNEEQHKLVVRGEEIQDNFEKMELRLEDEEKTFYDNMTNSINNGLSIYSPVSNRGEWQFEINSDYKNGHSLHNHSGSQGFDGLIAFDLSLLDCTFLPTVLHSEDMFTRMDNATLSQVIQNYERCKKQTFVDFGNKEVKRIDSIHSQY